MDFKEWTSITSNKTENFLVFGPCVILDQLWRFSLTFEYRKVVSSRPVYYSVLELLGQRPQYISIKFPLHKHSENVKTLRQATVCDFTVYIAEWLDLVPQYTRLLITHWRVHWSSVHYTKSPRNANFASWKTPGYGKTKIVETPFMDILPLKSRVIDRSTIQIWNFLGKGQSTWVSHFPCISLLKM